MVQPKSHQRLILEQVAAQYFLNNNNHPNGNIGGISMNGGRGGGGGDSKIYYSLKGLSYYQNNIHNNNNKHTARNGNGGHNNYYHHHNSGPVDVDNDIIHHARDATLFAAAGNDEDLEILRMFLDGELTPPLADSKEGGVAASMNNNNGNKNDAEDDADTARGHIGDTEEEEQPGENEENDGTSQNDGNNGSNNLQMGSSREDSNSPNNNDANDAQTSTMPGAIPSIQNETDIDRILEIASDHLSLGQNELALQAYRRAMKCAFADVISVKRQLMEVKQRQEDEQQRLQQQQSQQNDHEGDSTTQTTSTATVELTKQQEREFELTLLQVASRVADIHNNMGVVHEMNRAFHKAQSSYRDALDVYHNTCRRFEQSGDPDVDRTHRNVDRMVCACNSEKERKALHERAAKIAKRVAYEKHFATRKNLLNDAVSTLQMALELEGNAVGASHPLAASTLIQMGKYHYEMREYDSAVMEIRRAVEILQNALGGNHPQVGKAMLLLASVYERQGHKISPFGTSKDDAELELYVDALEPLKATLGDVHDDVGFLYVKIGYLYGKKGDRSLALMAYKAALKAYGEPSSTVMPETIHPETLSIWVRITEHLIEIKSVDEAVVAGRRALFLLRLTKNSLFRGARLTSDAGSSGASVGSTSTVKTTKKSQIQITSSTYYQSLFTTLQCLGQAHTSLAQYPLAKEACQESLQLAWEMALATQDNNIPTTISSSSTPFKSKDQSVINSILQVIRALKRLGKVHLLQTHYNDALQCFLPCLQLLRSSKDMECTLDTGKPSANFISFILLRLNYFIPTSNIWLYAYNGFSIGVGKLGVFVFKNASIYGVE